MSNDDDKQKKGKKKRKKSKKKAIEAAPISIISSSFILSILVPFTECKILKINILKQGV